MRQVDLRWVKQKRGEQWRCLGLGSNREGLLIVASARATWRLIGFNGIDASLVGDACNEYFHTLLNRKVCFLVPEEMKNRVESKGLGPAMVVCVLRKKLHGERDAWVKFVDLSRPCF